MLFSEASKLSLETEKNSKYTGKSTRAAKDDIFSLEHSKAIIKSLQFSEDEQKRLKKVMALCKKNANKTKNTFDLLDRNKVNSITRVHKRLSQILER